MAVTESMSGARSWRATCFIVGSENAPGSIDNLVGSLLKRGLTVHRCPNPHAAMADLLLHASRRRRVQQHEPLVLVVVEPDLLPLAASLHEAAARHLPGAVFWEYRALPEERLTTYRATAGPAAPPAPAPRPITPPIVARGVRGAPRRQSAPPAPIPPVERHELRLAGERPDDSSGGWTFDLEEGRTEGGREPSRLTEEELSMLLGGTPEGEGSGETRE